jgi:O2-independent ubiquinone biosynthesis protein UbiV
MNNKLSLGPILFNWSAEKRLDFYYQIADEAPVDIVYIGEVVCRKRTNKWAETLPKAIERLKAAGKEVVVSTLSLLHTEKEEQYTKDLIEHYDGLVEVNDVSALQLLAGKPHCIGPYVNIYNEMAMDFHVNNGAIRVALPFELPGRSIQAIASKTQVEVEIQVFGRTPLAISARCAHARAYNKKRKGCQYICDRDPNGMEAATLDHAPFLVLNGLQTMSSAYCNLLGEIDALQKMQVNVFRLSPHDVDMLKVCELYRGVIDHRLSVDQAQAELEAVIHPAKSANGFFHNESGCHFVRNQHEREAVE